MHAFGASNKRKSSQRNKKSRPFGKLTIDTTFASQGRAFPYESKVQELSFVSFEESKTRKEVHSRNASLKQQLQNLPIRPGPQQTVPAPVSQPSLAAENSRPRPTRSLKGDIFVSGPGQSRDDGTLGLPSLHKRVKGLRPAPLDLGQDVSPSDRAITIGIAVSPSTVSGHTRSANSPPSYSSSPPTHLMAQQAKEPRYAQEATTPVIVITPAKDKFSPEGLGQATGYRPASSVYSRYTNCMPRQRSNVPPVPPLPLFATLESQWSPSTTNYRDSSTTRFEEDLPTARTVEVTDSNILTSQSRRITAGLPTPRRSKGWWNLITSPFSAKTPKSFGSSPSSGPHGSDVLPILGDAASMGVSDPHAGVIFTNRHPEDEEVRSAPAEGPSLTDSTDVRLPKRSNTAAGALESDASSVNIYRIPSEGAAVAYYDASRHFPSLYGSFSKDDLAGWSPSQSVYIPRHHVERDISADEPLPPGPKEATSEEAKPDANKTLIGDGERDSTTRDGSPKPIVAGAAVFSTPSEEELKSAGLSRAPPTRGSTQATAESVWSPLSATPIVEDAHVGRFVGPHSSNGEQRQVQVESIHTPSHYGLGFATLGAATISHREIPTNHDTIVGKPPSPPAPPAHIRQNSRGLGISDSESDLYPPPVHLSEKPRLGTDRFGQLTLKNGDERPPEAWYRRFFWFFVGGVCGLVILTIVLLVVLVPQRHDDMSVQASWVNTTGFPALPTGVSTIIQPAASASRNTCVSPRSLWSCAAPGQSTDSLPNFRLELRIRNGTLPSNETALPTSTNQKRWQSSSPLHNFVRRSIWSNYLYTSLPSPPSTSDQQFLGHTTDNISTPYNGEETPFYISLLDPTALPAANQKRDDSNFTFPYPTKASSSDSNSDSSSASKTAPSTIPSPASSSDGKPLPQRLYPLPTAQPLRLFNRGQATEHYGFYTYFDRSIYVSNIAAAVSNSSSTNVTTTVELKNASAVCTFSQTRFHVQIWTKRGPVGNLTAVEGESRAGNSTGNDMTMPGSFPYSVTVTIDRHGGNAGEKGVYCYGLNEEQQIMSNGKLWIEEDRSAGGTLVNPAEIPGSNSSTLGKRDSSDAGGIDGGDGGCNCKWQNW